MTNLLSKTPIIDSKTLMFSYKIVSPVSRTHSVPHTPHTVLRQSRADHSSNRQTAPWSQAAPEQLTRSQLTGQCSVTVSASSYQPSSTGLHLRKYIIYIIMSVLSVKNGYLN